jgi:hypothetical protein
VQVCFRRPEQNRPHILSRHLAMSKSAASEKRPAAGPFPSLAAGDAGYMEIPRGWQHPKSGFSHFL